MWDFVGTHHSSERGDTIYQLSGRKALAKRDETRAANRPTKPMNHMNDRHLLNRVRGSRGASRTTLIPPDMVETVQADMIAIRNGNGVKLPDNHYEINDRTYAWEKGETYYPVSGPGLIVVDRPTLKAIQTFAPHGGINDQALAQLSWDQHMPSESVELAKELWRKRTNRGNDDVLD